MTLPGKFPFDMTPVDLRGYCCADPSAGGCGHELVEHSGAAGECRGVFGCSCTQFRRHKAGCIHQPELGGEPA